MLKKIALIAVVSASVLSGCATGLSPVGTGLFTNVQGPIAATSATGNKTGKACASTIIGLINKGDASIVAAKKAGGINTVAAVDYHTKGFYPFFGETCIIVTGN